MVLDAEVLTVLIAEDSAADRMLLASIVRRQGHKVLTASNGLEAVEVFERDRPQLVLMDALMPVMDGFQAAQRIKQAAGETLVPIIFLTSLTETDALVRCLEAGGDDFLAKPYNQVILDAKIRAMDRMRRLQATVLAQRDVIAQHNEYLLSEQRVAKAVFDKVAHSGCLNAPNVRYLQSPYALFNGDLLLAAFNPSGDMFILLGDFTGHGLPAAIGAMPLADVFYGMAAKGYSSSEILREMNAKLKRILPVGMFCCATLLNIGFQRRSVEVWNGGLPSGYLQKADGCERLELVSRHLPLGVLEPGAFDDTTEVYPLQLGDRLFLLSDGVLDTADVDGNLFGEQRLLQVLEHNRQPARLFDEIEESLVEFQGVTRDDISLVEVTVVEADTLPAPILVYSDSGESSPLDWSMDLELRGQTLRRFNPLPHLLQSLLEVHGLRVYSGALYNVLAELYSNALEHGVLGLDSALKRNAEGFSRYYQLRAARLASLKDGYVRFRLNILPLSAGGGLDGGGRLIIQVEDSGPGFNVASALARQRNPVEFCGRGLGLVQSLSDSCAWSEDGRSVSVEFSWPATVPTNVA